MSKLERDFQSNLIKELRIRFPGAYVMKLDANYIQGIPDLLILWNEHWATLECKRSSNASKRMNQEFYVKDMNEKSFSRFISPENKETILDELEHSFKSKRRSRVPRSK